MAAPPSQNARQQASEGAREGSSTIHTTATPEPEEEAPRLPDATLILRGGTVEDTRVRWADDVVDNEGMGRKSSKGLSSSSSRA
jgi:protein phosphatase 1 regulatory subunit 11